MRNYILAKIIGAQSIPYITKQTCVKSPIPCIIYLLKYATNTHLQNTHLQNTQNDFPIIPISLEIAWFHLANNYPHLLVDLSLQFFNKIPLCHITTLFQFTLPNDRTFMNINDFKLYYNKPTKLVEVPFVEHTYSSITLSIPKCTSTMSKSFST